MYRLLRRCCIRRNVRKLSIYPPIRQFSINSIPTLHTYRSLWGSEVFSVRGSVVLPEIKRLGFNGVEASLGDIQRMNAADEGTDFKQLLKDNGLSLICGVYTSWDDYEGERGYNTIPQHLDQLSDQLDRAAKLEPVHINIHSGSDSWTREENETFFEQALKIQEKILSPSNIIASHETHRGRSLFHPTHTHHLVKTFPTLHLTADISHWVVVCERLLTSERDRKMFIDVIPRIEHIHARVGSAESPQVVDPTLPRFSPELTFYSQLWEEIWINQINRKKRILTITPEIGPIPYTPQAKDGTPLIDNWELCNKEKNRLIQEFNMFLQRI